MLTILIFLICVKKHYLKFLVIFKISFRVIKYILKYFWDFRGPLRYKTYSKRFRSQVCVIKYIKKGALKISVCMPAKTELKKWQSCEMLRMFLNIRWPFTRQTPHGQSVNFAAELVEEAEHQSVPILVPVCFLYQATSRVSFSSIFCHSCFL